MKIASLQEWPDGRSYKINRCLLERDPNIKMHTILRHARKEYQGFSYLIGEPTALSNMKTRPYLSPFLLFSSPSGWYYGNKLGKIAKRVGIELTHARSSLNDLGYLAKRFTNLPVVTEVYDTTSLYDRDYFKWIFRGQLLARLGMLERGIDTIIKKTLRWERFVHERSDGLVYTSDYMLDYAKERYDCTEAIVIPNAVRKSDLPRRYLPKLSGESGESHVVYVGAIASTGERGRAGHRRILPYLEAIARKGINVHIYGFLLEGYDASMMVGVKKNKYIHWHDPLPYKQLYVELTKYDYGLILLAPAHTRLLRKAVPNKLYEYLAAGLPLVVSPYQSLVDFVQKYDCGSVLYDVDDIEDCLKDKRIQFREELMTREQEQALVNDLGISPSKLVMVPNGTDIKKFFYVPIKLGMPIKLLFNAHLDKWHSIDETLELARLLGDKVEITVSGKGVMKESYEKKAHTMRLTNVKFVGPTDHENVPALIQEHHFGICEYNRKNFEIKKYGFYGIPLKTTEYLACGRPMFTNVRSSALDSLIEEGVVFYFQNGEQLMKKLIEVLDHPDKFESLQKKARSIAERYDWQDLSERFIDHLYESAILT